MYLAVSQNRSCFKIVQHEGAEYPPEVRDVAAALLAVAAQGQAGSAALHWRYSLMANTLLLFLLPPPDGAAGTPSLTRVSVFCLRNVCVWRFAASSWTSEECNVIPGPC